MRYRFFAALIALEIAALALLLGLGNSTSGRVSATRRCNRQLVRVFELTDLSIWTGARYTRHLSQADVFSAFQDGMGALERFPAGALTPLPVSVGQGVPKTLGEPANEPAS